MDSHGDLGNDMSAKVTALPGQPPKLRVFFRDRSTQQACDWILARFGASFGGTFRPNYPPESDEFTWARHYEFPDQNTRDRAADFVRLASQQSRIDHSYFGISSPSHQGIVVEPPPSRVDAVSGAVEALRQSLNLPTLFAVGEQAFSKDVPFLGEWIANALVALASARLDIHEDVVRHSNDAAATQPIGIRGEMRDKDWFTMVSQYCEKHRVKALERQPLDLTPLYDAVRDRDWGRASFLAYDVRVKGDHFLFDRGELAGLELRISEATGDLDTAKERIDDGVPLEDPNVFKAAAETLIQLGELQRAEAMVKDRLVQQPESDAERLPYLISATLDLSQGATLSALSSITEVKFTDSVLEMDRQLLLGRVVEQARSDLLNGSINPHEVREIITNLVEDSVRVHLKPLIEGLPIEIDIRDDAFSSSEPTGGETQDDTSGQRAGGPGAFGPGLVSESLSDESVQPPQVVGLPEVASLLAPRDPGSRIEELLLDSSGDVGEVCNQLASIIGLNLEHPLRYRWQMQAGHCAYQARWRPRAIEFYLSALESDPPALPGDQNDVQRALRRILRDGLPTQRSNIHVEKWIRESEKWSEDPTLLLLRAILAAENDVMGEAQAFIERALQGLQLSSYPTEESLDRALQSLRGSQRDISEALSRITSLLRKHGIRPPKELLELAFRAQPLTDGTFSALIEIAVDDHNVDAANRYIARAFPSLGNDEEEQGQLAAFADDITRAAELFLYVEGNIGSPRIAELMGLAIDANLLAGRLDRATTLLSDTVLQEGVWSQSFRFDEIVGLVDKIYQHPAPLEPAQQRIVTDVFTQVAEKLLWAQAGRNDSLLASIMPTIRRLSPENARQLDEQRKLLKEESTDTEQELDQTISVDLTGYTIVIAGARPGARQRAKQDLESLGATVEFIVPDFESHHNDKDVAEVVNRADIVVNVKSVSNHQTTGAIRNALSRPGCRAREVVPRSGGVHTIVAKVIELARTNEALAA